MSGLDSKHLKTGDPHPTVNPKKMTIFNMRYCPYAQRAILVALAKELDFDCININLSEKPDWYESKHPLKQVPALQHGDFNTFDSLVIAEYLEEKFPNPGLMPKSPEQRAKDKAFIAAHGSLFITSLYKFYVPVDGPQKEEMEKLLQGIEQLEKELNNRRSPFLAGNKVGFIDYMVWPWHERTQALENLGRFRVPWDKFPKVTAWKKKMDEDAIVKKYRVSDEIHAKFIDGFVKGTPSFELKE